MDEAEIVEANREFWDASVSRKREFESEHLDAFLDGGSTLFEHEREAVGDVAGQSVLHLQCNDGLDTLSWAREGAAVTGIDISGESLRAARELRNDVGLDANFVQCNVYDVADVFDREFDVVYTSRGVLVWLPDLDAWAEAIVDVLADDGTFYLFEEHPFDFWRRWETMEQDDQGRWTVPDADVPLSFSLRATPR